MKLFLVYLFGVGGLDGGLRSIWSQKSQGEFEACMCRLREAEWKELAVRIYGLKRDGVNCLRGIFANFEGIMKINAKLQRKESRKQRTKIVSR